MRVAKNRQVYIHADSARTDHRSEGCGLWIAAQCFDTDIGSPSRRSGRLTEVCEISTDDADSVVLDTARFRLWLV
jgi:hypothetical protein